MLFEANRADACGDVYGNLRLNNLFCVEMYN